MKKSIAYNQNALEELEKFSTDVKKSFLKRIDALAEYGKLEFPEARKITRDIFEIRVSHKGIYRGFYAYLNHPNIIILHFFQKKTQEIPYKNIKIAERRLQIYA